MKRITVGALSIALLGILTYGAVKIVVIDPKTVSSVDDLLEVFYQSRNSLPPLPCPVSYETIVEQLAEGRVDFIASPNWAFSHDAGTITCLKILSLRKNSNSPQSYWPMKIWPVERLCLREFRQRQKSSRAWQW